VVKWESKAEVEEAAEKSLQRDWAAERRAVRVEFPDLPAIMVTDASRIRLTTRNNKMNNPLSESLASGTSPHQSSHYVQRLANHEPAKCLGRIATNSAPPPRKRLACDLPSIGDGNQDRSQITIERGQLEYTAPLLHQGR
jgi:hypothetical protein